MRALLVALALTPAARADDWPQFRGPTGDGHSAAKSPSTTWTDTDSVIWKTAIHDKGWSSPVILGDQVWMTTATEEGHDMFAVCVDRATGKVVHDLKLFTVKDPPKTKSFNSFASPTPALEPGRAYVHFGSFGTACLDTKTGKAIWRREAGELPCDHFRNPASSPVVWKNLLILTFDGFDKQYVAALNKDSGETVWKQDRAIKYKSDNGDYKKAYSTPSVFEIDGRPQLVSPAAEQTVAYEPATGKELWRVSHGGMNQACKPVRVNDLIILSSGHTSGMLAVKVGGKGELKKEESVAWQIPKGAPTRPSVLAVKDHLFLVNDQGVAQCIDAKTGKPAWEKRLDGAFSASPVFADGLVYFCGENGKTFVLKANPKEYDEVAVNKLPDGCRASPAILDDGVYLRTLTHLYKVGKRSK